MSGQDCAALMAESGREQINNLNFRVLTMTESTNQGVGVLGPIDKRLRELAQWDEDHWGDSHRVKVEREAAAVIGDLAEALKMARGHVIDDLLFTAREDGEEVAKAEVQPTIDAIDAALKRAGDE